MTQKLELIWTGKDKKDDIEPRILIKDESNSYSSESQPKLFEPNPTMNNYLIHGDNLLALKALQQDFSNKVKCIYIDPPYNTGAAFEHYDDNLEHSIWLSLMRSRLVLLKTLLQDSGLIFIQIDDNEYAYLKVLCDEVFGRNNYLNTLVIKAKAMAGASGGGEDKRLKKNYEFILVYSKNYDCLSYKVPINRIPLSEYIVDHKENEIGFYYTRVITNYGEKKLLGTITIGSGEEMQIFEHIGFEFSSISKIAKQEQCSQEEVYKKYFNDIFMVTNAQTSLLTKTNDFVKEKGKFISYSYIPTTGRSKGKKETKYIWNETLVVWLHDSAVLENGTVYKTEKSGTLWTNISWGRLDLEGGVSFKAGKKPEALLRQIIDMATDIGDIVLDSFLGSGTTCAVAHKMCRRWIGIEMGNQAYTHCKKRLDLLINGLDEKGITNDVNWTGGGGYNFYELAPSLINFDAFGQPVINKDYNADMLGAAIAKHEGYVYEPDKDAYWKQSHNGDKSFLFVTTSHLGADLLDSIHQEMKEDEFLLISCKSFDSLVEKRYKNIAVKKIPQSLLKHCEFGVDNYNLNIINPPEYEDEEDE